MEKTSKTANRFSGDTLNHPFPHISNDKTPKMPPQVNLSDRSWPFLGSLALHAMLLGIFSIPALQPPAIAISQAPNIFWLNPFDISEDNGKAAMLRAGTASAFAGQSGAAETAPADLLANESASNNPLPTPTEDVETADDSADAELIVAQTRPVEPPPAMRKSPAPVSAPAPAPQRSTTQAVTAMVKKVAAPLAPEPEPQREALPSLPAEQPPVTQTELKRSVTDETARQKEIDRIYRETAEQNRQAAERARQAQLAYERDQQAIRERVAAEKNRLEQAARENERKERRIREEDARKREKERMAHEQSESRQLAAATRQERPAILPPKKDHAEQSPAPKSDKPRGMSFPLLKGDLKLVVTGTSLPKITITFKTFALSRRNKPLNKAEARNETRLVPLVAASRENSREIVIEQAHAGIYTITAEPGDRSADTVFSLKLYEGTSRMIARELGSHAIARKKVLLKILMPEGILWDDDKSFTGNMEDSEGVTKFNAETGLMWKEYGD